MKTRNLRVVAPTDTPTAPDIYAADKAKIASIDWSRVHIEADRRRPFAWFGR